MNDDTEYKNNSLTTEDISSDSKSDGHLNKQAGKLGPKQHDDTEDAPPMAQFNELEADQEANHAMDSNLDVILDIPITVSMEIGRKQLSIRDLLQLNQGSVIELNTLAGEPMDVLVNGTLIAHGEVVVVNDKFGIRLTDVVSASERVKKLK